MERRLVAILSADVVGYSKLMTADEEGTLGLLKAHRAELFDPRIAEYRGRIIKLIGDGTLVEFASVVDAVNCAVAIQSAVGDTGGAIRLRMGINLGDVIVDGDDIYGDGVNIAARLEALAEPGGVCISDMVHQSIRAKTDTDFEDLGEQNLKNIDQPIRAWQWPVGAQVSHDTPISQSLKLPDKPSIAVLPFENMSGDAEQEYFADGIAEDIITEISRVKWLFVIARNSSFTYKGSAVDIKRVGRELGVRYVLEGSVRKAANRVRITGQLIDASTGTHLWADRFDGVMEDIFDLQDRVTQCVVGAIAPRLEQAEIDRAQRKPTESLDAYDYYLRAMAAFNQFTRTANKEALKLFSRAIELDREYAPAYGMAARSYGQRKGFGWVVDLIHESAEAQRLARTAANLGRDDAIALAAAGFSLIMYGEVVDGDALLDRALSLNPNLAWAWHISGVAKAMVGCPEVVVQRATHAMRLSPQDPQLFGMQACVAIGHYFMGQDDEAFKWAATALREKPNFLLAAGVAAASAAVLDKQADARKAMARLLEINPGLRISNLKEWLPFQRAQEFDRWSDGLRKAGLPE